MKFAFLIMGNYNPLTDHAEIGGGLAQIVGVSSVEEAAQTAVRLEEAGVDCFELCGAFGPDGAKAVIEATGGRVPVGYVTHLREQDVLYNLIFGDPIRED